MITVTNVHDQAADIAKVQEWLGRANVSTTRIYDDRKMQPEDLPTCKVSYLRLLRGNRIDWIHPQ